MNKNVLLILLFLAVSSHSVDFLYAEGLSKSSNPSLMRRSTLQSQTQAMISTPSLDLQRNIFRELLSSQTPELRWPAFPRSWIEKAKTTALTSNTSVGFKLAGIAGIKSSIEFKYSIKTSMVLITSTRRAMAGVTKPGSQIDDENEFLHDLTDGPMSAEDAKKHGILRFDENLSRSFPNIRADFPMVGFCYYEVALNVGKNQDGGIEFPMVSQSIGHSDVESMSNTFFSNFFQIRSDISMKDYLEVQCETYFRKGISDFVQADFAKMVQEYFTLNNPKNECQPKAEDQNNILGDRDCIQWHNQFGTIVNNTTTPRCEQQRDGNYKCVLKSKKTSSCSMGWDKKTQSYYPESLGYRLQRATGDSPFSYDCDEKMGLSCQMDKPAKLLLGSVVWPGRASCR